MYAIPFYLSGALFMMVSGKNILTAIAADSFHFRSNGVYSLYISIVLVIIGSCI